MATLQTDERVDLAATAAEVERGVLAAVASGVAAVVVLAPPGAGKTRLVEDVALGVSGGLHQTVCVGCGTVAQVEDLARRLATSSSAEVVIYGASRYELPRAVADVGVEVTTSGPDALFAAESGKVLVATTAKLAAVQVLDGQIDVLIIDEAWQLADYVGAKVTPVGRRLVLIGDPGQIPPVVTADVSRWRDHPDGPHVALPAALMARFPGALSVHRLVASRRLQEESARIVGSAFYPDLPFGSLAPEARLGLASPAGGEHRDTLELIGNGRTLVMESVACGDMGIEQGVGEAIVSFVADLLAHGPSRICGEVQRPLGVDDLGVVCSRVHQVAAVRAGLASRGLDVRVETAERWQGLEREVVIVFHPASLDGAGTGFAVQAGRMCVMTSRHRLACVVVAHAGVEEAVAGAGGRSRQLGFGVDEEYRGWLANMGLIATLRRNGSVTQCRSESEAASHGF